MLKRLAKLKRLRKKKGSKVPDYQANGDSVEYSDDQNSEVTNSNKGDDRSTDIGMKNSESQKSLDEYQQENAVESDNNSSIIQAMGSSDESAIETENSDEESSKDFSITIEDLKDVYTSKHADEDRLFREEMKKLTAYALRHPANCEYAKLPQNKEKNRYKNIVTSDKARVLLQRMDDDPYSDYINASYIDGYNKKRKFIATQGPKPRTINDFWRMVWEQKVAVIVMVTDYRENGKVKCENYFPERGSDQYGNIYVECKEVSSFGDFVQRKLAVRYEEEEVFENDDEGDSEEKPDEKEIRTITHLQCKKWPDHGVPKTTSSIARLYKRMINSQPEESSAPILVHCSAGVGRTGTLIGFDILGDQLRDKQTVNIHDTVIEMRKQRTEMVQGLDQYVLLHKLILEHHYYGDTDFTVVKFEELVKQAESEDEEQPKLDLKSEFDLLSILPPQSGRLGSGSLPANEKKNRDPAIVPYEHSQMFIRMRPTEMRPPYVNASPLSTYDGTYEVIAAQAPLPSFIEDFWRVITDNNVGCIVMLTPTNAEDTECCPQYWPTDGEMEVGEIIIRHGESIEHEHYTETSLSVTAADREKQSKAVTHLQFGNWFEDGPVPENCDSVLLAMIAHVEKHVSQQKNENGPKKRVLVHCSDGAGRTGVFCALINLLQRLISENRIDVFRTVKDLRDCRPCMVRTLEQYEFCYKAIGTYLRSFDLYSNGT